MLTLTRLEWINLRGNERLTALPFEIPFTSISKLNPKLRMNREYGNNNNNNYDANIKEFFQCLKASILLEEGQTPSSIANQSSSLDKEVISFHHLLFDTMIKVIPELETLSLPILNFLKQLLTISEEEGIK